MITVLCGEDSASSRNYLNEITNKYKTSGYEVRPLPLEKISLIYETQSQASLFHSKIIFVAEKLSRCLPKKRSVKNNISLEETFFKKIILDKNVHIISWEDSIPKYLLKYPHDVTIKEFSYSKSVFIFNESCNPGNKLASIDMLRSLCVSKDASFVYFMLIKHIKNLILISENIVPNSISPWQKSKLFKQATKWKKTNLISFYDALCRIDILQKTSSPYRINELLEIILYHYL